MSISVELLATCPHCQADLTPDPGEDLTIVKDSCWSCGRKLKNPTNKHFESPDYLYHQKNSLMEELGTSKLKPGDTKYDQKLQEIQRDLIKWVRGCATDDKLAPLYDAIIIMENIIFTDTPPQDIKIVVSLAKKIGTIANAVEQYFKAGGASYDREIRPLRPDSGESSWDQATATAGRNS